MDAPGGKTIPYLISAFLWLTLILHFFISQHAKLAMLLLLYRRFPHFVPRKIAVIHEKFLKSLFFYGQTLRVVIRYAIYLINIFPLFGILF